MAASSKSRQGKMDEDEVLLLSRNWWMIHAAAVGALAGLLLWAIFPSRRPNNYQKSTTTETVPTKHCNNGSVPFIFLRNPDWKQLHKSVEQFRHETQNGLEQLSMAMDVAQANDPVLTSLLQQKIDKLSRVFEEDLEVLQHSLLRPFPYVLPLTGPNQTFVTNMMHLTETKNETGFSWIPKRRSWQDFSAYESPTQVLAHLVRDWSHEGALVRNPLYEWCLDALREHGQHAMGNGPVLVPGAGLGRLAWEIAVQLQRPVEALEASLAMAAAAYSVLHIHDPANRTDYNNNPKRQFRLHPYATDPFRNEVQSSERYHAVVFPDVVPSIRGDGASLSYTVGEFSHELILQGHYDAMVSCFFLDTASSIFEYLLAVSVGLKRGGLFVNVGPLHWHANNKLPLSVDELRMVVENYRTSGKQVFDILHWSVDEQPIPYRAEHRRQSSTHLDAYQPLRFVLRKK